jgi:hypothetical protein
MKLPIWMMVGVPVAALALGVGVAISACSSDKLQITPGDGGVGGTMCSAAPGAFPDPNCTLATNGTACTNAGTCAIATECGDKNTCLPLADNTGKSKIDLRIRRLTVVAPSALASNFIQGVVVDQGITLNAKQCGEHGDGAFNWLIRIDKTAGTATTGGAPPTTDPFGVGYCFANAVAAGSCIHVTPITAPIMLSGNTFSTAPVDKLNVPIFVSGDRNSLIILPISYVAVKNVTFSADGNCIGGFNYAALDKDCNDSRGDCDRWTTAGSLGGYITLEEADQVPIPQLGGKTLCVMLTGSTPGTDGLHCKRDANNKIMFTGDFCSTTKMPGGCGDAYWMAATFAASAVKVDDASSDPLCNGATTNDGGASCGTMTDAGGGDAGSD